MNVDKILKKAKNNPQNIRFTEMQKLIEAFGYRYRGGKGSHCVFKHESISEIMNLQEEKGMAKAYQIKDFFKILEKYNLQRRELK
ncbi:MAG: type II toxin-antitoxin system HicA family toxin [Candidatus Anammoxibacter sp.]